MQQSESAASVGMIVCNKFCAYVCFFQVEFLLAGLLTAHWPTFGAVTQSAAWPGSVNNDFGQRKVPSLQPTALLRVLRPTGLVSMTNQDDGPVPIS